MRVWHVATVKVYFLMWWLFVHPIPVAVQNTVRNERKALIPNLLCVRKVLVPVFHTLVLRVLIRYCTKSVDEATQIIAHILPSI